MELSGDHRISAPHDQVWAVLKSPDMLRHCLPGCKSIRQAKHAVTAAITVPLDGLGRPFTGRVILTGFDGQDGGLLVIEGSYSFKSFGPRTIEVRLNALDDGTTLLAYRADIRADADGDGPVDSPVILDAAQRLGADFVARLGALFAAEAAESTTPEPAPLPTEAPHGADEAGQAESELFPLQQDAPLDAPIDGGSDNGTVTDAEGGVPGAGDTTAVPAAPSDPAAAPVATTAAPPPGLRPMVWIPILVLALLLLIVLIR